MTNLIGQEVEKYSHICITFKIQNSPKSNLGNNIDISSRKMHVRERGQTSTQLNNADS